MSSLTKNFCCLYPQGPDRHSLANQVPAAYHGTALAACAIPATGVSLIAESAKWTKKQGVPAPQLLQFTAWWFKLIRQTCSGAPEIWAHIPAAGGDDYLLNYCKQVYEIVSVRAIVVAFDQLLIVYTSRPPATCPAIVCGQPLEPSNPWQTLQYLLYVWLFCKAVCFAVYCIGFNTGMIQQMISPSNSRGKPSVSKGDLQRWSQQMMYLIQKASLTLHYEILYIHCNSSCNAFTSVYGCICVHAF